MSLPSSASPSEITTPSTAHLSSSPPSLQFGLMFFASGQEVLERDKYRLVLESAKFADQHGFASVWLPERHFTQFGCLYPNPAVLHAALARETQRVGLRAGSVVLPLHHPIRVAEEWAMVDNLSGGRVGISFASGWNPSDFAFFPEKYAKRHQEMYEGIQTVQALWQGESIQVQAGDQQRVAVQIYPTPVQPKLPTWITAAGNPNTFVKAGEIGANLLTHLFDQDVTALAEKIALYRQARSHHGHDPEAGQVTVTLHTFLGKDLETVRQQVREPYCTFLKSNRHLLKGLGFSRGLPLKVEGLSAADLDDVAGVVFEKFFGDRRALLGTPESCLNLVQQLQQIGVNEIACLLDFGLDTELILQNLPYLNQLREAAATVSTDPSCASSHLSPNSRDGIQPSSDPTLQTSSQISSQISSQTFLQDSFQTVQQRCDQVLAGAEFYQYLSDRGVDLAQSFQGIEQLWRRDGEALGCIRQLETLDTNAAYIVHPAFLDACFQVLFATLPFQAEISQSRTHYLPVGFEQLHVHQPFGTQVWSHAVLRQAPRDAALYEGDVHILDANGTLLMQVTGLRLQRVAGTLASDRPSESRPAVAPDATHQSAIQDWFYHVEWQPTSSSVLPLPALASPQTIAAQLRQHGFASEQALGDYRQLLPQLEALSVDYIVSAFHQIGWQFHLQHCFSSAEFVQQCHIVKPHQRLVERLLQILQDVGILAEVGDRQWQVCQVPAVGHPLETWRSLHEQYPTHAAELDLLGRCGQALADVLLGHCDPLHVLFPNGSFALVEQLYQHSPAAKVMNQMVQQAIATALASLPSDRPLRILELGAGTGGTTASVLPHLPPQTDYRFTDVSPLFLAKAQQKFGDSPGVQYQILDIEQPQAALAQQFDLILAANVLHATADLNQTLNHVQQMLAPGGLMVLLEGMQPQRWLDLIFGLTEGWWKFRDSDLRPHHALLSQGQWRELLQERFAAVEVVTPTDDESLSQQGVILAMQASAVQADFQGDVQGDQSPVVEPGDWLVFADRLGVGQHLASALRTQGDRCTLVYAVESGTRFDHLDAGTVYIHPDQPDDFRRLFQTLAASGTQRYRGLIYLWGLEAGATDKTMESLEAASMRTVENPLHLLQALETSAIAPTTPLWLVTRGAQAVISGEAVAIAQSMLWGLGRVLAVEQPQRWGGLIDLDPASSLVQAATDLWQTIQAGSMAEPIALRRGQCYAARLVHQAIATPASPQIRWRSQHSYLITGGLGDLGLAIAHWMVEQGARHVILLSRRHLPPRDQWPAIAATAATDSIGTDAIGIDAIGIDSIGIDSIRRDADATAATIATEIAAIQALERQGAKVYVATADVSCLEQVQAALQAVQAQGCPAVRGVFHLAGVPQPLQPLAQIDRSTLTAVLKPKVLGGWVLHHLFAETPLDYFVLFSSWSSLLGTVGQRIGGYSMANTFLDALAHHRQSLGQPALSINWGDWAEIGMRHRSVQAGYRLLPDAWTLRPQQGLDALALLLPQQGQTAVLPVAWSQFFQLFPQASQSFLAAIAPSAPPLPTSGADPNHAASVAHAQALLQELETLPPKAKRQRLMAHVQTQAAAVMGIRPADSLDPQRGLFEMGMDSLMALELKTSLESSLGQPIPAVAAFEHPTVAALATYLAQEILGWDAAVPDLPSQAAEFADPEFADPLTSIAQLSDDDVDRLFAEKISR
ncbi:MupA/Atu3671 family FMN-dependent luciferase-like monooxygenase [Leptolyngbya sp. AN02str]|uniref:MupA/Atu3671 family FMN-dependent luciferase-like monooxygenase n=1 Tax=Leptolyngbya sp. AN02str TaxID=3423363 RepID=UPI003D316E00